MASRALLCKVCSRKAGRSSLQPSQRFSGGTIDQDVSSEVYNNAMLTAKGIVTSKADHEGAVGVQSLSVNEHVH
jgi:hypothetical protein